MFVGNQRNRNITEVEFNQILISHISSNNILSDVLTKKINKNL